MFNKLNNKTDLLINLSNFLKLNKIENHYEESQIIISHAGGEENFINVNFEKIDNQIIDNVINQRIIGKPLSKIIKQKGFWKNVFYTNDDTLDPRADSEIIIENILKDLLSSHKKDIFFIDICCGTGCLGISLLKELQNSYCDFIDVSKNAMMVCEKNIKRTQVNSQSKTFLSNLFDNYPIERLHKANFLVCNPPYIPSSEYLKLDNETLHDPRIALDGGDSGTIYYFKIINYLKKNKFIGDIYFEIDPIITEKLEKFLLEKSLKISYKKKDYLNLDRLLKVTFP